MKRSLFQILMMMEMFQLDVRAHDETYLLSYLGLNQGDGSKHCKQRSEYIMTPLIPNFPFDTVLKSV